MYRLGAPGQESTNGPLLLQRQSVRWLRLQAANGAQLDAAALTARAVFAPLDVVFVAGASGPYQLARAARTRRPPRCRWACWPAPPPS
ncbi:DUF3999 family protein, partial [Ramlibacter sp.]|uniref:DUF3999 family protein n=1 Tax=Ramlibacter sp. TaxID=1917967 RepID=UPI002633F938